MSDTPDLPREVLLDLVAIYAAGEASPATRALVEAHLARDPELARMVREAAPLPDAAPPPDVELRALRRTRGKLALQRWLFGFAVSFTAIALSLEIDSPGGVLPRVRLLILDRPGPFGLCLAIAAVLWIAYGRLRRTTRTGL